MSARQKSLSLKADLEELAERRATSENRTFSGYVQHLIKRDLANNGTPYGNQSTRKGDGERPRKLA